MEILRIWAMPNKNTFSIKPIKELLQEEMYPGIWLDPFARNSKLATITNDLNPETTAEYHLEARQFLGIFESGFADGVLFDPPYNLSQMKECYDIAGIRLDKAMTNDAFHKHKNEVARVTKSGGKVISFGWNSNGMGKKRGFEIIKILIVPHGGNHNDTIVTVERKL
jgi:hypothetical protein